MRSKRAFMSVGYSILESFYFTAVLQSWRKMSRKMDIPMSSFKIMLLKALSITNMPPPPKKNNAEVRLDHF